MVQDAKPMRSVRKIVMAVQIVRIDKVDRSVVNAW
jgi:hypothetical protein